MAYKKSNIDEMDKAGRRASNDLNDIDPASIKIISNWMKKWFKKAGYKRLSRALIEYKQFSKNEIKINEPSKILISYSMKETASVNIFTWQNYNDQIKIYINTNNLLIRYLIKKNLSLQSDSLSHNELELFKQNLNSDNEFLKPIKAIIESWALMEYSFTDNESLIDEISNIKDKWEKTLRSEIKRWI